MTTIQIRVSPELKQSAEMLYAQMGIGLPDAIRMFLQQSINDWNMPFKPHVKIPNAETIDAMEELDRGEGTRVSLKQFKKMLKDLES